MSFKVNFFLFINVTSRLHSIGVTNAVVIDFLTENESFFSSLLDSLAVNQQCIQVTVPSTAKEFYTLQYHLLLIWWCYTVMCTELMASM